MPLHFSSFYIILSISIPLYLTTPCNIKGVSPDHCTSYQPSSTPNQLFDCGGNTNRKIPYKYINDDYCDCPNTGADEPGTSACIIGQFWCNNIGYYGKYIYSSWVNDGKCDCCDGSDEWNNKHINCPNICHEKAKIELQKYKQKKEEIKLSLSQQPNMIKKGNNNINEQNNKKNSLLSEIDNLRNIVNDLRTKKEELETKEREYRELIEAKKEEEQQKELENDLNKLENTENIPESNEIDTNNNNNEETHDPNDIVHTPDEEFPYSDKYKPPGEDEVDDDTKTNENDKNEDGFDWSEFEKDENEPKQENNNEPEPEPEIKDPKLVELEQATQDMRNEYNTKDRELRDKENELENINKILNIDYGHGNLFASLINECFELSVNKYIYVFCPFNEMLQKENEHGSGTNLGKFKEIIYGNDIIMKFEDGLKCWNGPHRSTNVKFECFHENKIKNVQEPSTCKYDVVFLTPLGCKHSQLKEIDDILVNTFKTEL